MVAPTIEPFEESWRRYRRWYRTSVALQVGFLPSFLALGALVPGVADRPPLVVGLFFAYVGTWMTSSVVARRWLCPQCGEQFFLSKYYSIQVPMAWIRSCGWCDLPKDSSGPAREA
jgi:ribosomal protein S27AE